MTGAPESIAAKQQKGTIEGELVDFVYNHVAETGEMMLSYATPSQNQSEEYVILHVRKKPAEREDGSKQDSMSTLECTTASGLPDQFVHDFALSDLPCWHLRRTHPPQAPNLHIIISTKSGTGLAKAYFESVLRPLWIQMDLVEDRDYAVHHTRSEQTVTELTESMFLPRANEGINQTIVLMSGDGGLLDIVNSLLNGAKTQRYTKPVVALLPCGTGNGLAHSLRITGDNTMGTATLVRGRAQPLPLMRVTFSAGARLLVNEGREEAELPTLEGQPVTWGAVVCSWGMHATLVADSDTVEYRKHGAERFKMAANEALYPKDGSQPHEYQGRVSVERPGENDKWELIGRENHAYVLATMVSNLEKGFTISPASRPLDAKLRIVHFGPMLGDEIMNIMVAAYQGGKHVDDDRVGYEEIEAMRISFQDQEDDGRWRRVCVDGKIIRVEKNGWVEVRQEQQKVVDVVCASLGDL